MTGTPLRTECAGLLRIDFPEGRRDDEENLEEITWSQFFTKFDEENLAMVVQDRTSQGEISYFNKFVDRNEQGGSANR